MLRPVDQAFPLACVALEIAGFKVVEMCDADIPAEGSQVFALTFEVDDSHVLRLEYEAPQALYRIQCLTPGVSARPEALQLALRLNFVWAAQALVFSVDPVGDALVLTQRQVFNDELQADDLALAIAHVVQCMLAVSQSPLASAADLADSLRFQSSGMIRA